MLDTIRIGISLVSIMNIHLHIADLTHIIFRDLGTAIIIKTRFVKNPVFCSKSRLMAAAAQPLLTREQIQTRRRRALKCLTALPFATGFLKTNEHWEVAICRQL